MTGPRVLTRRSATLGCRPLELGLDRRDDLGAERPRSDAPRLPHDDRVAPPLLGVAGVQVGPVPREQERVDEGRGERRVHVARPQLTVVEPLEQPLEPRHVEGVVEALAQRLGHDREFGQAPDRLQERVGLEALQGRGRPLAADHAWNEKGAYGAVAEARREERRADERPPQQRVHFLRRHELRQALERRRGLARREGEEDAVVHVARLGLQPEHAPDLLAQRHAPGAVHAHAEDRVDHRVAPAHLVGERLDDDPPVVGHAVEDLARLHEPRPHGRGGARVETTFPRRPVGEVGGVEALRGVAPEPADGEPELPRARRVLALPERDRRRHALRVLDQHAVGAHLEEFPRVRAEEEHVPGQALGDELLVERADLEVGVRDEDVEEPRVGDGPAGGERQEAAAAARVEPVVHAVPEDARPGPLDLGGKWLGDRAHDSDEILAREPAVRRGVPEARVERVEGQRLGGDRGDDLLGQHVEGGLGHRDPVELALADRTDDGCGLE